MVATAETTHGGVVLSFRRGSPNATLPHKRTLVGNFRYIEQQRGVGGCDGNDTTRNSKQYTLI